jgi:fido (protein-threonine AMPylation protein)
MDASGGKYDVSGNVEAQYVDEAHEVLVNKMGIADLRTLQIAEEEALARAYGRLLAEVRTDTPMTCDVVRSIHRCIFCDLYEWCGRWRTVQISKPGAIWPAAQFLDQSMAAFEREVLARHPASALADDEVFCAVSSQIQGGVPLDSSISRRQRPDHQTDEQPARRTDGTTALGL